MNSIGRYRLTRRLGAGSFATVWQGHDDDLDVEVAVKVLAENWTHNDDVRSRFLTEARIMRKIRDERIVRVYDIGSLPDGRPYFVMDYADGGSLDDLRKQGIPPALALRLCAEASRALHVLHSNDIIHRDVTPGNVLLNRTRDNGVKVLIADLGVAKSMVGMAGATMTAGTPAYMALEQATGVGVLDHRADIYSLAAVTYAMLTGRPPFPVRTLPELLARDATQPAEPIAARVGAPPLLDTVLQAALGPQPGRRPQTALELADALDQCADQIVAPPYGPAVHGSPAAPRGITPSSLIPMGQQWGNDPVHAHRAESFAQPPGSLAPGSGYASGYGMPAPQSSASSSISGPGYNSYPSEPPEEKRPATHYVLAVVSVLALFVISLLITIVLLS